MFHWLNKIPAGKTWQDSRTSNQAHRGRYNSSAGTYLKFEWLHIVGAGSEVGVDQGAPTERSTVRVLLQSHAVPLAVATVQTLSVTTCSVTVIEFPFFCLPTCMLAYFRKYEPAYLRFIGLDFVFWSQKSSDLLLESCRVKGLFVVSSDSVEHTDVLCPEFTSGSTSETGDSSSPLSLCKHGGSIRTQLCSFNK